MDGRDNDSIGVNMVIWTPICQTCWNLPFEEKQYAIEEYRKMIFR